MVKDWRDELEHWLAPFVAALKHKTRGRMCPAYIVGLIGPGDRKSVQPMAARDAGVSYDQLHHFIANGVWDAAPLEAALLAEADRQVGGNNAWLIVDDTALPKKGRHSVGVAPQYASALGKNANCQTLVFTDAGIGRSAGHGRATALLTRELDERSGPARPRWRARWPSCLQDQA